MLGLVILVLELKSCRIKFWKNFSKVSVNITNQLRKKTETMEHIYEVFVYDTKDFCKDPLNNSKAFYRATASGALHFYIIDEAVKFINDECKSSITIDEFNKYMTAQYGWIFKRTFENGKGVVASQG